MARARDASGQLNLIILHLMRCTVVPSSTWYDTCIHVMVKLLSVINCLSFFFLLSLLTTKMHSYHLFICCLLESDITSKPKSLESAWLPNLTLLPFNDLNLSIWIFSSGSVVTRRLFGSVCVFFNF